MPDPFDDTSFESYESHQAAPAPMAESLPKSAPVAYADRPEASLALHRQDDTFSEIESFIHSLDQDDSNDETGHDDLIIEDELDDQSTDQTLTSVEDFLAAERAQQPVGLPADAGSLVETTASADQFLVEQRPASEEVSQPPEAGLPDIDVMTTEVASVDAKDLGAIDEVLGAQDQSNDIPAVAQPSLEVEMAQPQLVSTEARLHGDESLASASTSVEHSTQPAVLFNQTSTEMTESVALPTVQATTLVASSEVPLSIKDSPTSAPIQVEASTSLASDQAGRLSYHTSGVTTPTVAVAPTQVEVSSHLASPQLETVSYPAPLTLNEAVVVAPQEVQAPEAAVEAPPLSKWLDATLNDVAANNAPAPEAIAAGPIPQAIAAEVTSAQPALVLESNEPNPMNAEELPLAAKSTLEQSRPSETLQSASLEMFLRSDVAPEVQLVQHQAELQRLLSLQEATFVPSDSDAQHAFAYAGTIDSRSTWQKLLLEQQAMVKLCQTLVAYQYDLVGFAAQAPVELAALGIATTIRMGDQTDQQAPLSTWIRPGKDRSGSWMEAHHQDDDANTLTVVIHGPPAGAGRDLTEKAVDIVGR